MTPKNISAEEKLLRLIKGRPKEKVKQGEGLASKDRKPIPDVTKKHRINIPSISFNKKFLDWALVIFCIILSSFLILQILLPYRISTVKKKYREEKKSAPSEVVKKQYNYFIKDFSKKRLFKAPVKIKETPEGKDIKAIKDLIKDISLVGIILKGEKFVAIIEDRVARKTYFLNEGDWLGELLISHIEQGKVTVEYQGQKSELYL